ncbi:hypothetical protein LPTSP4_11590 [Leptospira ryugenii]|uniref:Tetratricopeptide repeat protein n=1 Tax=Leptospira ryugenii TaxID=1917863 RepID=A0A2P2DYE0_9LEPT|nr:hypothetical protein [Leptospira ryugenii]GBF49643.1 hypothetical protein LPTSP4_11590 [Leptospira ryugenii]
MLQKSEEALHSLSIGEFEKAKSLYSVLLDKDPDDLDHISGYFIASFWDNRLDLVLRTREGKERGKLLLNYFSDFEIESKKRQYHKTQAYYSCQKCILEEASEHLKLAYRWEGANALDFDSLADLAICLVKVGDFKSALEVFPLSLAQSRMPTQLRFFLAEALCMTGRDREGRDLYMRAFLEEPDLFPWESVRFLPLQQQLQNAQTLLSEPEAFSWFAVLLWQEGFFSNGLPAVYPEVEQWAKEMQRMHEANLRGSHNPKKVKARLLFYAYLIKEKAPGNEFREALALAKTILAEV